MKDNCLWITQFFCSSITLQYIMPPSKLHSSSPLSTHLPPSYPVVDVMSWVQAAADSMSRQFCEGFVNRCLHFPSELLLPSDSETIAFAPTHHSWCYKNKMIMSGPLLKPCVHGLLLLIYSQSRTLCLGYKILHPVAPALCSILSCHLSSP